MEPKFRFSTCIRLVAVPCCPPIIFKSAAIIRQHVSTPKNYISKQPDTSRSFSSPSFYSVLSSIHQFTITIEGRRFDSVRSYFSPRHGIISFEYTLCSSEIMVTWTIL
jgi:hypothetical protein